MLPIEKENKGDIEESIKINFENGKLEQVVVYKSLKLNLTLRKEVIGAARKNRYWLIFSLTRRKLKIYG